MKKSKGKSQKSKTQMTMKTRQPKTYEMQQKQFKEGSL